MGTGENDTMAGLEARDKDAQEGHVQHQDNTMMSPLFNDIVDDIGQSRCS